MISHDFNICKLRKKTVGDLQDVIYEVEYFCRAYSEKYTAYNSGLITFEESEVNPDEFIPYQDLDKDIVLSWILNKKDVDTLEQLDVVIDAINGVQNQIDFEESGTEVDCNWGFSKTNP